MSSVNSAGNWRRSWLIGLAVGGLVFLLFYRCTSFEFLHFDDPDYVTANPEVQKGLTAEGFRWAWTTFRASNWHPLTWLSLQCDATLFGVQPWGFHFTNVLLHAAAVMTLFLALHRLTKNVSASLAVALLFGVHPLRVESVAWISERKDVLSVFLGTLSLWCYAYYAERQSLVRWGSVFATFAFSLLAKPMLVTLPCVLLLLDYWPLNRFQTTSWKRLVLEKLPLVLLTIGSAMVTLRAQKAALAAAGRFPFETRLANALLATLTYVKQAFWPFDLGAFYPHSQAHLSELRVWGAIGLLLLLTGLAFRARDRAPWLIVGWLWFLGTLAPVLGVYVQQGDQGHADRYTYWPHIGLGIAIVWGVSALIQRWHISRIVPRLMVTFAILVLCWRTILQAGIWHDTESLWKHTLQVTDKNAYAEIALGSALDLRGDKAGALSRFRRGVAIDPSDLLGNMNLAAQLGEMGHLNEAEGIYRRVLATDPNYRRALTGLGLVLADQGRPAEARVMFEKALDIDSQHAATHFNLALLLSSPTEIQQRLQHLEAAIQAAPQTSRYYLALAETREWQEQDAPAEVALREALRLNSDDPTARERLALLLERNGRASEALPLLQEGISRLPQAASLYRALGLVQETLGDAAAAATAYSRSRLLDTQSPVASARIAWQWATHPDQQLRRPRLAASLARQLIGIYPQNPDGYEILAAAYAAGGQFDDALKLVERALSLAGKHPDIAARLKQERVSYRERRPWTSQPAVAK